MPCFSRRVAAILTLLAALHLALAPLAAAEHDWPQWRGPTRDGISKETGLRTDWAAREPKVLWRASVGLGFSTVSVANERVYTLGHIDGKEIIFCLDAGSGQEKWKHAYPCSKIARFYEGGSSSTPTIDGDRVYVLGKEGQFFCLDAGSGDRKWYLDLQEELKASVPEWGYACSPLVLGDLVIVQANCTAAFNKMTGKLAWKTKPFSQAYGSPIAFEHGGKTYVADLNTDGLIVADAKTGAVAAMTKWQTMFSTNATTPIISGDRIFISTGYGKGCGLFQFTGTSLKEIYTAKSMANHMNNSVLHQGHLYGIHGNSHDRNSNELRCIDLATGESKWAHKGLGTGAVMLADGKLIVTSDKGDLLLVDASPAGYKELAKLSGVVRGKCWTVPVLSNGRIYCRSTPGDLACVEVK